MEITAQLIATNQHGSDQESIVTVNGIQFVAHDRPDGGLTTEKGKPGIVYHRGNTLYRGIYNDIWELVTETAYTQVTWPHFSAAMRLAKAEQGKVVTVTTDHPTSNYGQPVVLVDNKLTDLHQYL